MTLTPHLIQDSDSIHSAVSSTLEVSSSAQDNFPGSSQTSDAVDAVPEAECNISIGQTLKQQQLEAEQISLGDQLWLQGDLSAAADAYYQATQFNPYSAIAVQKLVEVLIQLQEWDKAAYLLPSAIELDPGNADLRRLQGQVLSHQSNFEAAIAAYRRALELNPDFTEVQDRLDRVSAALRKETVQEPEIVVTGEVRNLPAEIEAIVDLDIQQARRILMDAAIVEQFETLLHQTLLLPQENGELHLDTQALVRCLAELQTDIHYLKTRLQNPPAEAVDPQARKTFDPSEMLRSSKRSVTRCDLRQRIVGQGWHEPEQNGRWTGPTDSSSIVLPYPQPGQYRFEMLVLAEVIPGLLESLELYVNETPLDFTVKQTGAHQVPAVVQGEITIDSKEQPFLAIDILIEKTVLPPGTLDERLLGLLISHINLIPVQER